MKEATMLFKEGGDQVFVPGGKGYHTIVVDASEVEAKVKEGWKKSFFGGPVDPKAEAKAKAEAEAKKG